MPDVTTYALLNTQLVSIRDVHCAGRCRHESDEESARAVHMVFPYRGIYIRHLGSDDAVAEANQVLFFNADEGYRVSHPVPGGDASLDLMVSEPILDELVPRHLSAKVEASPSVSSDCASIRGRRRSQRCFGTASRRTFAKHWKGRVSH